MVRYRWVVLSLVLAWMLASPSITWSQSVTSPRFVLNNEDGSSNVTGTDEVGAVFADQQVVFEFTFTNTSPAITGITLTVSAININDDTSDRTVLFGDAITCRSGAAAADLSASGSCQNIAVAVNSETLIRVSFNSNNLPLVNNRGEFDLFAEVVDQNGDFLAQTTDAGVFLRIQIAGTVAVDLAIEGPVLLEPEFPKQGERVTLSFFVINNNFQNPGSINTLDFDVRVPGAQTSFAPTTFLELNCFIERVSCVTGLPVDIGARERKRIQIQFITSQLPPTAEGANSLNELYLLRLQVNQSSRSQEGGNEVARNNNEFIVAFGIDQPVRDFDILLLSAPTRITQGQSGEVSFGVTNRTSLVLENNALEFVLESQALDPQTRQPLDFAPVETTTFVCDFNPPDIQGAFGDETCGAFDLFIAETRLFTLQFSSDGLEPDVLYRLSINLKALGEDSNNGTDLVLLDEIFASEIIEFSVASVGGTGTDGGTGIPSVDLLSPELRPIDLQFVPSATVEQGTSLVVVTTIKNTGNRQADDLEVTITLEPELSDGSTETVQFTHFFPRLGIGLSLEVRQALETQTLAAGRYRVRVEVQMQDPQAGELDPNNNVLEGIVNIVSNQGENSNEG